MRPRWLPRRRPKPRDRRHVLRYFGLGDGSVRVICDDCRPRWSRTFDAGHDTADWVELDRQHSGPVDTAPSDIAVSGRWERRYRAG